MNIVFCMVWGIVVFAGAVCFAVVSAVLGRGGGVELYLRNVLVAMGVAVVVGFVAPVASYHVFGHEGMDESVEVHSVSDISREGSDTLVVSTVDGDVFDIRAHAVNEGDFDWDDAGGYSVLEATRYEKGGFSFVKYSLSGWEEE